VRYYPFFAVLESGRGEAPPAMLRIGLGGKIPVDIYGGRGLGERVRRTL